MNELALFAGAGGGILGTKLLGWRVVCAVEWDARFTYTIMLDSTIDQTEICKLIVDSFDIIH